MFRPLPPVPYVDFIALLQNVSKVITDSRAVLKGAYLLKIPCITNRKNTEWIESLRGGSNVLTGRDSNKIVAEVRTPNPTYGYDK
jgi:UDP-GlcNAc3NAcA epimerase